MTPGTSAPRAVAEATEGRRHGVAEFWNSSRAYYEAAAAANPEASAERQALIAYLAGEERLLDLGSGSCENALWIPGSCHYVGVDLSTTALLMAAESRRPGVRIRADGGALPIASGSLDAVLSTYAVEHFHDPGRTFAEVGRVLRPGGLLLLVGSTWDLPYDIPASLSPGRRLEVAVRRTWRQLGALVGGRHRFDIVREPRVLRNGYVPDADAVHVVQSFLLVRFLRALGFDIMEHRTLPHRADPGGTRGLLRRTLRRAALWRHGWGNTLIVARRGGELRPARYRLQYL